MALLILERVMEMKIVFIGGYVCVNEANQRGQRDSGNGENIIAVATIGEYHDLVGGRHVGVSGCWNREQVIGTYELWWG